MSQQVIQEKAARLKAALAAVGENRQLWQEEKKALLLATLQSLADLTGLGLRVQHVVLRTNQEAVTVRFPDSPSGIVERRHNAPHSITKRGGKLTFSQAYNGDVFLFVVPPSVEDVLVPAEDYLEGRYPLREVTEAFITDKFGLFLDLMTEWEGSNSLSKIGFQRAAG